MLPHLSSPLRIGNIELRNRIAMAPMGVGFTDADGHVRERVIRYYEERARGGAGLIIVEVCAVAYPHGATTGHQPAVSDDRYLPGLEELARRVHAHGAKVAMQLVHHGKVSRLDVAEGREVLMPSEPVFHGSMDMVQDLSPEELGLMMAAMGNRLPQARVASHDDIAALVESFAAAAVRARRAGFDAVEIHGGHGYIISEFLSPAWNFRKDEYGGCLENRARLLCEVIAAVKERTGGDFTVWCRLDAVEYRTPGGIEPEAARATAELAVEAGSDAIHVSAYADSTSGPGFTEAPLVHREAGYVEFAAEIKARVAVPVIAVGRIEPEVGERLIAQGKADVIAMARKMLADPAIAAKLVQGRPEDVRPCIYSYTCVAQPFFDRAVRCSVNPVLGREEELAALEQGPAAKLRKVCIVGSGPAGLEAARVAALRGHRVRLCEKQSVVGGHLRFAALLSEPDGRLLGWYQTQLEKLKVEVQLKTDVTLELLKNWNPDLVLVAVGGRRCPPAIDGIDAPYVFGIDEFGASLLSGGSSIDEVRETSRSAMEAGRQVVVLGGSGDGIRLAAFLAERGREVTVLEEGDLMAPDLAHPLRWRLLYDLRQAGVKLLGGVRVSAIDRQAVHFENGGHNKEIAADTVITVGAQTANNSLAEAFSEAGLNTRAIGDCLSPGGLEGAIAAGFNAAVEI
ncbi:MAG: FAD-dependent oxidoreductase [Deltaproteobacteria bacterium]